MTDTSNSTLITDSSEESDEHSFNTNSTIETSSSDTKSKSVESLTPFKKKYLLPHEILDHQDREIRAEDESWIVYPVPSLVDIILNSCQNLTGPVLPVLMQNATDEQRKRLQELLPLDLPLNITLQELEDGEFWKRRCLEIWKVSDVWWYNGNWKSMFVERQVQEMIETFIPGTTSISNLESILTNYTGYVIRLRIRSLKRLLKQPFTPNFKEIDWADFFDDFEPEPPHKCYVDFNIILPLFPQLQELSIILSPVLLGSQSADFPDADFFGILKNVREHLKLLQKFRFSNGCITNSQIVAAIRIFLSHPTINDIDFSFNFANDDCCNYFGKLLLSSISPIHTLSLKYNRISDAGVTVLAASLTQNDSLKTLDLSLNSIGDEGVAFLAGCLAMNKTLESLNLSENKLGEIAGVAIAQLLMVSTSLKLLNISRNSLGMKVGKSIEEAMKVNLTLLELDFECCKFQEDDESSIHKALTRNRLSIDRFSYWDKRVNFV